MGKSINWKLYNRNLVERGQITFWFSSEITEQWFAKASGKKGTPAIYSDTAMEVLSVLRFRFHLTLRSTQGFAESLMQLLKIDLPVPDYSTLCRRLPKLSVKLQAKFSAGPVHVVVDSTGLKVFGEGEWKVRQHGYSKRRTWMKLHYAVDSSSNQIISAALSNNSFKDNQLFADLIDEIPGKISQISGDGAYDTKDCYEKALARKSIPVIPPRGGAILKKHGNCLGDRDQRDEHIREIRKVGRKQWKKNHNYHQRSLAETAMSRLKTIFGGKLSSRNFDGQANEAFIKTMILNKMKTPKFL